jgi:hypothetical protein
VSLVWDSYSFVLGLSRAGLGWAGLGGFSGESVSQSFYHSCAPTCARPGGESEYYCEIMDKYKCPDNRFGFFRPLSLTDQTKT